MTLYNEERKRRYIDKKESEVILAPNFLQNLFKKTAPFEEKYGKDLCEWTTNEIIEFYQYSDVYSLSYMQVINSNYALYTTWCIAETLVPDGQNHFLEMTPDTLASCVNNLLLGKLILSYEDLQLYVDKLDNFTDRFLYYAIFSGIVGTGYIEITHAKYSDIDLEKKEIHLCTGRVLPVSSKLIDVAKWASEEENYHLYNDSLGRTFQYKDDDSADLLFKGIKSGNTMKKRSDTGSSNSRAILVIRRFRNVQDYLGLPRQLTPKKLLLSGKINYMKNLMKKEDLSLEEVIKKHGEEIDYIYQTSVFNGNPASFIRKYGMFFE